MIRYSVTATLNTKDTLHEYYEWLINNQIPAVLNNGAITHELSVVENDQNKEYLINTLYKFPTIEIMNNYLNNIAPNLPSLHDCYVKFYETKKVLNFQRYVGRIEYYYQSSSTKNPLTILPGMIRYNVIATLASIDYLDEYTTWLANGHIQAVVNAGGLAGEYNILHNDDPNIIQVASMYLFPHMDALNSYFNGVATVLRADGIRLFVETNKVLKFERYVGNIRNATNGEDKSLLPVDIAPYLMFNGQCRDAMNFYNSCFEGELQIMV